MGRTDRRSPTPGGSFNEHQYPLDYGSGHARDKPKPSKKERRRRRAQLELDRSLQLLDGESWKLYIDELRSLDANLEDTDAPDVDEEFRTERGRWKRSDAGHPLGRGMPMGAPIMPERGGSHRDRWAMLLRLDPCSYCGRRPAETLDHIVPQSKAETGEAHGWFNYTAACGNCNRSKSDQSMLHFMLGRVSGRSWRGSLAEVRWVGFGDPTKQE